jgi:hypothetical protein
MCVATGKLETYIQIHSFIYSFIQIIVIEHLLYFEYMNSCWFLDRSHQPHPNCGKILWALQVQMKCQYKRSICNANVKPPAFVINRLRKQTLEASCEKMRFSSFYEL